MISLTVIALVTEDGVLIADILLRKLPILVCGVKAAKPGVIVITVIDSQAEALIPVTRLVGQVSPRLQAMLPIPILTSSVVIFILTRITIRRDK